MTDNVSVRLQAALERLDQAIDRLDERLTTVLTTGQDRPASPLVAERLDQIIRRIETALAE